MEECIYKWLTAVMDPDPARRLSMPLTLVAVALMAIVSYFIMSRVIHYFEKRTDESQWHKVAKAACQLAPALMVAWLLPSVFVSQETVFVWITKFTKFYIVWACVLLMSRFVEAVFESLKGKNEQLNSMNGVMQMIQLVFVGLGVIVGAAILFNREPISILTAFGAFAAVLMLVFRDTILGFVASIQLTANKMLNKGDWIICEKAGINGEVMKISLTTIKVRNWDNSTATIPPYTLISDSFRNMQSMRDEGGRRVSRFVYIDVNSVRFLTADEISRLREEDLITEEEAGMSGKIVNLGVFRHHIHDWLGERAGIVERKDTALFTMVRQLQPTPQGIPLELYFFTDKTQWEEYETEQSDIFDYVYAVLPRFGLRIYQAPSGHDVMSLAMRQTCGGQMI